MRREPTRRTTACPPRKASSMSFRRSSGTRVSRHGSGSPDSVKNTSPAPPTRKTTASGECSTKAALRRSRGRSLISPTAPQSSTPTTPTRWRAPTRTSLALARRTPAAWWSLSRTAPSPPPKEPTSQRPRYVPLAGSPTGCVARVWQASASACPLPTTPPTSASCKGSRKGPANPAASCRRTAPSSPRTTSAGYSPPSARRWPPAVS